MRGDVGRARELGVRAALTVGVAAVVVGALSLAEYEFDFGSIWDYRAAFAKGLVWTLSATLAAYALGMAAGLVVALARLSSHLTVRHLGDLYVEVIRGTPFLAQLAIAYFGIAPLFGILVVTITVILFAAAALE